MILFQPIHEKKQKEKRIYKENQVGAWVCFQLLATNHKVHKKMAKTGSLLDIMQADDKYTNQNYHIQCLLHITLPKNKSESKANQFLNCGHLTHLPFNFLQKERKKKRSDLHTK